MRMVLPILAACMLGHMSSAGAQDAPRIYRCVEQGTVTFRDRPCGNAQESEVVIVAPINSYESSEPSKPRSKQSPAARTTTATDSIAEEQQRAKQRCRRIDDQLAAIESSLRSGYTLAQGERLRERQRQLERQRRTEHCR